MIITHKNTGTLGDFAILLPLISSLKNKYGYIHISLPEKYSLFSGLKEFLCYQDFIDDVDFLDINGDLDIQSSRCNMDRPCRARCQARDLGIDIDENFTLNVKDIHIDKPLLSKPIVIDKNTPKNNRPIMLNSKKFPKDKYHYIQFDKKQNISYNINLCLKNNFPVYSCLTGFAVLLQFFFNMKLNIVWFSRQDQHDLSIPFYGESRPFYETYFNRPNVSLLYWKDVQCKI